MRLIRNAALSLPPRPFLIRVLGVSDCVYVCVCGRLPAHTDPCTESDGAQSDPAMVISLVRRGRRLNMGLGSREGGAGEEREGDKDVNASSAISSTHIQNNHALTKATWCRKKQTKNIKTTWTAFIMSPVLFFSFCRLKKDI